MKQGKPIKKGWLVVMILVALALYYYMALPVINIHAAETWVFLVILIILPAGFYGRKKRIGIREIRQDKGMRVFGGIFLAVVAAYLIGSLLSSPIINAKKYQKLMAVEKGTFSKDVEELSFDKIPLLDRDTAEILGDRKMGSMVDMVSQFEADNIYSQINYKGNPVRVTPLRYASWIKWLTNRSEGIPAYIRINMADQTTELVKLEKGIRYTTSEHFNRNIYRHLRFAHPTYIYGELSFEIDERGVPYWIAPVKKYNIGLFGGETIGKVVLCNAITGETKTYAIDKVPQWVDRAYSADMLVKLFDYHGTLKHGFFNSILSQKDCLETTDGYNYLALDDDVWMYTGVTSVNGDQSNVGFVLSNQRTMETKYYEVEGATESAAMSSAEGQVQHLKYQATFPLLLNISDEPTYFIALKDEAGLVKKYAMVNVQKYQIVAIGDSVSQCQEEYLSLLFRDGVKKEEPKGEAEQASGTIEAAAAVVLDGNTHYYLTLQGDDRIYDVAVQEFPEIIRYQAGSPVTLEYQPGEKVNQVTALGETGQEVSRAETEKEQTADKKE
ncbi:CvpA family protein [Clostridiaceae bacterium 68-1-5]|uniref:CvpA family protein n=1 Tax=Suipraeoptans intestinalis TaxID=2606628 RepID=A0A6N7V5R9_9FIRM|nr:CvpA family protein [Suipraeoptans intestinalis]MSR94532.1 CvpA family protein [Suipraeoptans intestinalis]